MEFGHAQARPDFFLSGTLSKFEGMLRSVILFIFLLITTAFRGFDIPPVLVHRLIVLPDSRLTIDGRTNVNTFTCAIPRYQGKDTLVLHEGGANIRPVFVKGSIMLDASSFDCGMALMTSDFRKTIESKSYPSIVIDFISFERTPRYGHEEKFKGIVKISLGGVTKVFEMDCSIEAKSSGLIHLIGEKGFTFSDFNLQPPKRMMGLVKVEQSLNVGFHLILKLDGNKGDS